MPAYNCLFFDGGEHGAIVEAANAGLISYTTSFTGVTLTTTATARHLQGGTLGGAYAYIGTSTTQNESITFLQPAVGTTGRYFYVWFGTGSVNGQQFVSFLNAGTAHMTLLWSSTNVLELRRGGTGGTVVVPSTLLTVAKNINVGTWWKFEVVIHDTTGIFKAWANGNLVVDFSGDTRNGATAQIDQVQFGKPFTGTVFTLDDFAVFDSTADPGNLEFFDVSPDPNSDISTGLTRSTGATNFDTIDDRPVSATDYNAKSGAVAGDGDTYGHAGLVAGLGITPTAIASVKVSAVIQRDGVIAGGKLRIRSGGVTYTSSTIIGAGAGVNSLIETEWNTNPDGGADWSDSSFDSAGHGVEGA